MKVLQIVCDGAPGGGTNHVLQLLGGLNQPIQCTLLTQQDTYLASEASKLGIDVRGGDFFRSRLDRKAVATIRDTIADVKPDLIHCHGGRAAFFRGLVFESVPTTYTVHGFHFARKPSLAKKSFGWAGELWNIRRCDQVIFVCDYDRQLALRSKLMPGSVPHRVIYNGIPAPAARPCNNKLGVGFIGRFVYQKNPQLFLDTIEQLDNVRAVMVGGGDLDDEVRNEIQRRGLSERITLLGSLDHQSTLDTLARLDVLLMTPRWEGLPLLPLEAMFLGVPVVSTPVGGIPEVLDHGVTGMLSEQENAAQLADYTRMVLEDTNLRESIVAAARDKAERQFSQAAMLRAVEECYEQLSRSQQNASPASATQ